VVVPGIPLSVRFLPFVSPFPSLLSRSPSPSGPLPNEWHDVTENLCVPDQDPAVSNGNLPKVKALLLKVEKALMGKNYLVGNSFTVADVVIGGDLLLISTCLRPVRPKSYSPVLLSTHACIQT
jgi:glutathione S-transferase